MDCDDSFLVPQKNASNPRSTSYFRTFHGTIGCLVHFGESKKKKT